MCISPLSATELKAPDLTIGDRGGINAQTSSEMIHDVNCSAFR